MRIGKAKKSKGLFEELFTYACVNFYEISWQVVLVLCSALFLIFDVWYITIYNER